LINQGSPRVIQPRDEYYSQRIKDDPLNHSKYHSKLQSLQLETSGHGVYFSRVFSEGLKRYPLSLKNLTITSLLNIDFPFHFKRFLQLESVNLKFSQDFTGSDGLIQQNLGPLSELPNLQALSLEFNGQTIPTIHPILLSPFTASLTLKNQNANENDLYFLFSIFCKEFGLMQSQDTPTTKSQIFHSKNNRDKYLRDFSRIKTFFGYSVI